jgi:hypothetical protein
MIVWFETKNKTRKEIFRVKGFEMRRIGEFAVPLETTVVSSSRVGGGH